MIATQGMRNVHRDLIETLEDVERGLIKRLRISCPARLGKSQLWAINFPARYLGRHSDKKFVLASATSSMATKFGKDTRHLVMSQRYKNVFPEFQLAPDQWEKANWETTKGWGMFSVGVGWQLTGRWGDVLYIDDPVRDMADAQSSTVQESTVDWYESVLATRKQSEDSAIILTMTRWDTYDLAWYLEQKEKEGWDVFHKFTIKAIDDADHPIIWPGKRGPQYFIKERESRSYKVWMALYQQDPTQISGNIFKPGGERYFIDSDFEKVGWLKKSDIIIGLHVDPAFSTNVKSDDIVLAMVGQHKLTKDIYIFDIFADTKAPSEARRMMFHMLRKWKMNGFNKPYVSIEQSTINKDQQKFYKDWLAEMEKENEYYTDLPFRPRSDKAQRIRDEIEPMRSLNKLYFNKNMPADTLKKVLTQIFKFPNDKHDDAIDCIAQSIYQLRNWANQLPEQNNRRKESTIEIQYDPLTNQKMIPWQRFS